jgi:hypothetical protein
VVTHRASHVARLLRYLNPSQVSGTPLDFDTEWNRDDLGEDICEAVYLFQDCIWSILWSGATDDEKLAYIAKASNAFLKALAGLIDEARKDGAGAEARRAIEVPALALARHALVHLAPEAIERAGAKYSAETKEKLKAAHASLKDAHDKMCSVVAEFDGAEKKTEGADGAGAPTLTPAIAVPEDQAGRAAPPAAAPTFDLGAISKMLDEKFGALRTEVTSQLDAVSKKVDTSATTVEQRITAATEKATALEQKAATLETRVQQVETARQASAQPPAIRRRPRRGTARRRRRRAATATRSSTPASTARSTSSA